MGCGVVFGGGAAAGGSGEEEEREVALLGCGSCGVAAGGGGAERGGAGAVFLAREKNEGGRRQAARHNPTRRLTRVVAARKVVGRVLLAADQLLGVEELAVGAGAHLVDDGGLEVEEDAARDVLARARLREEGVERVVAAADRLVARHLFGGRRWGGAGVSEAGGAAG